MTGRPEWLPEVPDFAGVSRGCRVLSWTLPGPGSLARNSYEMAWVEITEERPFKGEPLRVWFTRRRGETYSRESFTDAGRLALKADLMPYIARAFGEIWSTHSAKRNGAESARLAAEKMAAYSTWWEHHAALMDAYAQGVVDLRPTPPTPIGQHPFKIRVLNTYRLDGDYEEVMAEAMMGGERVGWMTTSGLLAPTQEPPL